MEELQKLYEELKKYSDFSDEINEIKFVDIAHEIASKKVLDSIPIFFKYMDDEGPTYVMESLMILIESYEEPGIKVLLQNINKLVPQASFLANALLYGIMNSEEYLNELKKVIHLAPKESLVKLFDSMERESPPHKKIIDELRQKLEQD